MSSTLRVLLVEDQTDLRELMTDVLVSRGMQVRAAADANAALEWLKTGEGCDVLFSDVYMPGRMSGAELSMQVARLFPDTRIILVSGHARHQLPELPDKVEFVQKPYSLSQVVRLIQNSAPVSATH